jgi:hypothetical protein
MLLAGCGGGATPSGKSTPATQAVTAAVIPPSATPAIAATAVPAGAVNPTVTSAVAAEQGAPAVTAAAGAPAGLAARRSAPGAPPSERVALPTVTPRPAPAQAALLPTRTPTHTPNPAPVARSAAPINVRSGPGTEYPVIGGLEAGSAAPIVGRNAAGDWWQVEMSAAATGWVYAPLAQAAGDMAAVAIAANIPAPPTPAPTVQPAAPPAADLPAPAATPVGEAPTAAEPTAAAPAGGPDFRVVEKRLWDVYENGGFLVGDSVHCGEKRQLVVNVLDANGSRINGVAVQAEYGAREIIVTGSQGRGDGVAEFVLGGGQDVKVIRDNDGRAVTSEMATGLSTNPAGIPFEYLIAAQYCTDEASCRHFVDAPGCFGHYSWTVTFQRNY